MQIKPVLQIFLLALALFICGGQSHAIVLDRLYSAVIKVSDNTLETRNKYLPQAFEEVVLKVACSSAVLNNPEYIAAREHLDRFVSSSFYTVNGTNYNLTLQFSEQLINNLLIKAGYMPLGKNRPQILLWLVVAQQDKVNFVTHGLFDPVANKIDVLANKYGVPIIMPLLDLNERSFIAEQDVVNFNVQPLQKAADRYKTHTLLIGKMSNVGATWNCEWRLVDNVRNVNWQSKSVVLDAALEQMINHLTSTLTAQNAQDHVSKIAKHGVAVHVRGINTAADYTRILEYLKTLDTVQKVEIGGVDGTQATFIITANGGRDAVVAALNLNTFLTVESAPGQDLTYRISS